MTKTQQHVLRYGVSSVVGFVLAMYVITQKDPLFVRMFYQVTLTGLASIWISVWAHVAIHETGHLLGGWLAGYSFVSYRLGSYTWIKENGRITRKQMSIPGTGGQCLMEPPLFQEHTSPYVLYNMGGVLLNLMSSFLGLVFLWRTTPNLYIGVALGSFSVVGLFTALVNGIPLQLGGLANDGYNLKAVLDTRDAKYAFYLQLKVNAHVIRGARVGELPYEWVRFKEERAYSNHLIAATALYEYKWHLDQLQMKEAKDVLTSLVALSDSFPHLFQQEIQSERLFMELVGENRPEYVEGLYTGKLVTFLDKMQGFPSKKRVLMAYYALHKRDYGQAKQYEDELKESIQTYAVQGDAKSEWAIAQWVKEKV